MYPQGYWSGVGARVAEVRPGSMRPGLAEIRPLVRPMRTARLLGEEPGRDPYAESVGAGRSVGPSAVKAAP